MPSSRDIFKNIHRNSKGLINYYINSQIPLALYEQLSHGEAAYIDRSAALAASLGIAFNASGATAEPGMSLKRHDHGAPWALCRRPWTVMYITANGRALSCCIAPFSQRGYENYTLGDATQQTLREMGLRWSL